MAGQLIPPPELAPPPLPADLPSGERYLAWLDMLGSGEKLLLVGLRDRVSGEQDIPEAFRRWYEQTEDDRLRERLRRASELRSRRISDAD